MRTKILALACLLVAAPTEALDDPVFNVAPPIPGASGAPTGFVVAGDVDADGDQDIVSSEYASETVAWYENDGGATPVWTKRVIDGFGMGPQAVAAGDADGDGDLDVFSTLFNEEVVAWYENGGGSPPVWTKRVITSLAGWGINTADIDRDGDLDVLAGNRFNNTPQPIGVQWYENNGATPPTFTVHRVSAGFVDASSVRAADLDGDLDLDIVSVDLGENRVLWYENPGPTTSPWPQRVVTAAALEAFSAFTADVDGDGDVDVLSASSGDDTVAWHENSGTVPPTWTRRVITAQAPQVLAVFARDLDLDGDVDVASGAWGDEIAWYENTGGSPPSFTRRILSTACRGAMGIFAARLDPDADVDLVAACNVARAIHWFPSHVALAESDGDGVPDAQDCAPNDASAFAVPLEVENVRHPAASTLAWNGQAAAAGSGTVYDVLRGSLTQLPVGSGAAETCLASGVGATSIDAGPQPAVGTGAYFLVRASNICGTGGYGTASSGLERTSSACP